MRILFVTQVLLDRPYGGPRHVLAVARAWAERGHEVRLLAPGQDPETPGVHRVRPPPWVPPGARLELVQAALAAREVARARPDVAYVRLSASTLLVPAALRGLGLPFVTELNGCLLDELRNRGRSEAAIGLVARAQRLVAGWAFATVAVERAIGRHARRALGARDVRVIENGADLSVAVPGDRGAARRALGLPEDAPILAFAGTLAPELRFDLLFAALKDLPERPLLVVAGDGPAWPELEARARPLGDRVRWLGAVPHATAITLLQAADVGVSVRDGHLGMKPLEYAAVGRRFVAFREEGADRLEALYPDHRAVRLVQDRSAAALAGAIAEALADEAAAPLPPEAVARARSEVGWERTAARVEAVLEEAVAKR